MVGEAVAPCACLGESLDRVPKLGHLGLILLPLLSPDGPLLLRNLLSSLAALLVGLPLPLDVLVLDAGLVRASVGAL